MAELQVFLVREIRALLHAEQRFVRALPKLANAARNEELRAAFEHDIACTQEHVEWLSEMLEELDPGHLRNERRALEPEAGTSPAERDELTGAPQTDISLITLAADLLREHEKCTPRGLRVTQATQGRLTFDSPRRPAGSPRS